MSTTLKAFIVIEDWKDCDKSRNHSSNSRGKIIIYPSCDSLRERRLSSAILDAFRKHGKAKIELAWYFDYLWASYGPMAQGIELTLPMRVRRKLYKILDAIEGEVSESG